MSEGTRSAEVLVIGGGLSGAMAGMRMAAAGRDVLLLEQERSAHHKVCGEFLSPEAVGYVRQAGIEPLTLGAASIEQVRLSMGKRVVQSTLPFRALSLSRCVLDEALLARAISEGCTVRRGLAVRRLSRDGQAWTAELSDGTETNARSVFLATGKHDLRGWARPDGEQGDLVGFKMAWHLNTRETESLRGFMDLYLFEGGYGGLSLVEGDAANLCLVLQRSNLRRLGGWHEVLASLLKQNRSVRRRLEGSEPAWPRPLAVSSIPYGYLANDEKEPWCVGDQAAVIPSFTGDGMAIALHSGALGAEMYLAGESAGAYQRILRAQLQRSVKLATLLSKLMVSDAGRSLAPLSLRLVPAAIGWIAKSTRIPNASLVPARC